MAIIFPPGNEGDKYTASNGIIYEFSDGAWRLAAGNVKAGVHVGTTPPNNPQAGDLWWHSGEADLKIYYIDPTSEQWVPASSPPDPYEENFVSVTGDKMTGRLNMVQSAIRVIKDDGTVQFNLSPNNSDYFTNIYAFNSDSNNGGMRLRVAPGNDTSGYKSFLTATFTDNQVGNSTHPVKTELNWLRTPTSNHHAANKQYVDDKVADAIDNIDTVSLPGRRFTYSNSYGDNLPTGGFHISGNGDVMVSRTDKDGIEIATTTSDSWSSNVKFFVTIRDSSGSIKHAMSSNKWYQGKYSSKCIEYSQDDSIRNGKSSMVNGQSYWIADGIYCI